jgi:hypothetical protein
MQSLEVLLGDRLNGDEAHGRPTHRFTDVTLLR